MIVTIAMMVMMGMMWLESGVVEVKGMWCVARSDATDEELQRGLDYACAAGADCAPIQVNGLCYLPNTLQAHASYAFNSYFQRNHMSPGSCDFSASATFAKTDPSYGSCMYPASPSTAGGITSTNGETNPSGSASPFTPTTTSSPTTLDGGAGAGINPNDMGPPIPTATNDSKAPLTLPLSKPKAFQLVVFFFLVSIF